MEGAAWVERRQGALRLAETAGCRSVSACPSWCPWLPCRPPRLCLWMLYLISHVWNSNYGHFGNEGCHDSWPHVPGVAHTLVEEEGPGWPTSRPHQISTPNPLERGMPGMWGWKHLREIS